MVAAAVAGGRSHTYKGEIISAHAEHHQKQQKQEEIDIEVMEV